MQGIIAQIPLWILILLVLLIVILVIAALRTGREIQFWPPSLGPAIAKTHLEEQIKVLQTRLDEEEKRYSKLQADHSKLEEKISRTWRPLGGNQDQDVGRLLALFDRRAMRVPMDGEDLVLMLHSLEELRVKLQTAGISTLSNPLVREIFEEMRKDLEWVEETAGFIPQFTGPAQNLLAQHTLRLLNAKASLSPNSIKQTNPNMSGSGKTEIDQLTRPIDFTIERSGWPKHGSSAAPMMRAEMKQHLREHLAARSL